MEYIPKWQRAQAVGGSHRHHSARRQDVVLAQQRKRKLTRDAYRDLALTRPMLMWSGLQHGFEIARLATGGLESLVLLSRRQRGPPHCATGGPPIASAPLGMLRVVKMDRSVEERSVESRSVCPRARLPQTMADVQLIEPRTVILCGVCFALDGCADLPKAPTGALPGCRSWSTARSPVSLRSLRRRA
jgi:hypothetical protein